MNSVLSLEPGGVADYNIQDGATATLFTTSMRGGAADGDGADGGAVSTS